MIRTQYQYFQKTDIQAVSLLDKFVEGAKESMQRAVEAGERLVPMFTVFTMYTPEGHRVAMPACYVFSLPSNKDDAGVFMRRAAEGAMAFCVAFSLEAWMVHAGKEEISPDEMPCILELARMGRLKDHPKSVPTAVLQLETKESAIIWAAPIKENGTDRTIGEWEKLDGCKGSGRFLGLLDGVEDDGGVEGLN